PRYAIRFESSMTRFAELTAASDRAHFAVLESAAGVVLEQILLSLDFAVPDGSAPFRCETIAGTLARQNGVAAGEDAPHVRTADAGRRRVRRRIRPRPEGRGRGGRSTGDSGVSRVRFPHVLRNVGLRERGLRRPARDLDGAGHQHGPHLPPVVGGDDDPLWTPA